MLRTVLPWAVTAAVIIAACGGDDDPPGQPPPVTTTTGTAGNGGSGQGGGTTGSGGTIVDQSCADLAADGVEIYPASAGVELDELHRVGSRWAAVGRSGWVTFEDAPTGALPAPNELATGPHTATSDGTTLAVVALGAQAMLLQPFDADGNAMDNPAGVETDAAVDASVTISDIGTTVVWAFNTKLRVRTMGNDGAWLNDPTDALFGAYGASVRIETAAAGDQTGLLWNGDPGGSGKTTVAQVFDGLTEITDMANIIYNSPMGHDLAGVVTTEDGFVALLTLDGATRRPALFTLNPDGQKFGPTRDIENGIYAHGLATDGVTYGVISGRRDESDIEVPIQPMLRVLNANLQPTGAPFCLGPDLDITAISAIAADGDGGYATIYTAEDGAVIFHRLSAGDLGL